MKSKLAPLLLSIALVISTIGCATTGGPPQLTPTQIQSLGAVVQFAAADGTSRILAKHPETRQYFVAGVAVLDQLQASGKFDPASLDAAMKASTNKTVQQPDVQMAIDLVFSLYQANYGQIVSAKLDSSAAAPLLKALNNGIRTGLGMPLAP